MRTEKELRILLENLEIRERNAVFADEVEQSDLEARICVLEWILDN